MLSAPIITKLCEYESFPCLLLANYGWIKTGIPPTMLIATVQHDLIVKHP